MLMISASLNLEASSVGSMTGSGSSESAFSTSLVEVVFSSFNLFILSAILHPLRRKSKVFVLFKSTLVRIRGKTSYNF